MPLVFLHTDLGPAGYSKYLAWFLAREGESFTLVWCYLNEAGKEFWCWLYRFPSNQMTTVHLHGDYAFSPLSEPTPASLSNTLSLHTLPTYSGADFTFRNWSRRLGTLPSLELHSALATGNKDAASSASTLRNLKVTPLHELAVGPKNGWRTDAWKELHALAYDAAQSPYYLILYSNSEKGFVVDLKQAQVFTETEAAAARLMPVGTKADTGKKVLCPMPGLVISIAVTEGQDVKTGETLAVIEAMKMQNVLRAERDGVVKKVHATPGATLAVDAMILEFV